MIFLKRVRCRIGILVPFGKVIFIAFLRVNRERSVEGGIYGNLFFVHFERFLEIAEKLLP